MRTNHTPKQNVAADFGSRSDARSDHGTLRSADLVYRDLFPAKSLRAITPHKRIGEPNRKSSLRDVVHSIQDHLP